MGKKSAKNVLEYCRINTPKSINEFLDWYSKIGNTNFLDSHGLQYLYETVRFKYTYDIKVRIINVSYKDHGYTEYTFQNIIDECAISEVCYEILIEDNFQFQEKILKDYFSYLETLT